MILASTGLTACRRRSSLRSACGWLLVLAGMGLVVGEVAAKACVWKVTSGAHVLYLAGSVHALRPSDYPLPAAYDQAFEASSALAFETDLQKMNGEALQKVAYLPRGSTLRDHLDPRVYQYILQVIANVHGSTDPAKKLAPLRPWAVAMLLRSPKGISGVSSGEGVEAYLLRKAVRAHKETVGLVPLAEHVAVFGGMNDADSQAFLLLSFIQLNTVGKEFQQTITEWKRGDIAAIDRTFAEDYRDVPSLRQRIITDRNRRWLPEIVQWLQSGKTYTVVAGTAHMAGGEGLPALLRAQGFGVEQL